MENENTIISELMDEEEARQAVAKICRDYPMQRKALKNAYVGLSKANAIAQLAVTLMDDKMLTNPDAQSYLIRMREAVADKATGVKMLAADKEAIVLLETCEAQEAYDLAKFDCETSDKDHTKLASLLMYYMSDKKFTGATEKLGEDLFSGRYETGAR